MNILAALFFIILIVVAIVAGSRQKRIDKLTRELTAAKLITQQVRLSHIEQDTVLDYVLTQYLLSTPNPYVQRPTLGPELRCFHCNIPLPHKHANECPWVIVQPLVKTLYQNPSK